LVIILTFTISRPPSRGVKPWGVQRHKELYKTCSCRGTLGRTYNRRATETWPSTQTTGMLLEFSPLYSVSCTVVALSHSVDKQTLVRLFVFW